MPKRTNSRSRYSALPGKRRVVALIIFISLNVHLAIANSRLVNKEVNLQSQANQSQDSVSDKQAQTAFDEGMRLYGKDDAQSLRLAIPKFEEAAKRFHETNNRQMESNAYAGMGATYNALGEKQKALDYYNLALPIRKEVRDRRGEATVLNNIGLVYSHLGEKQKALDYYNLALPIRREVRDRGGEATTLHNIGSVYSDLGEKQKALDYYNQALPIRREVGDRGGEAATLNNIGLVYGDLGEKQKALDYFNLTLLIRREVRDRRGEATALHNLGWIYGDLGERQKALDYYNLALLIRKEVGDRRGEATTLNSIMVVYVQLQQPRLATLFGKQSVNIYQSLRADISGLDKVTQQTFLKSIQPTYRRLSDLLIAQDRLPEAEFVVNLLKQYEYFEYVRHDEEEGAKKTATIAYSKAEAVWENRYSEIGDQSVTLGQEFAKLAAKPVKFRTADENQKLLGLSKDLNIVRQSFEKFIIDMAKEFSKSPLSSEIVTDLKGYQNLQETLKSLGKGTVALFTLVGENKYRIVLVTPFVYKVESYDISDKDLNDKIFKFRDTLQNRHSDPIAQAQELYKILIGEKMAKHLQEAKAETVLWSLDGALRYLPVTTLHDGKQYLVERYRNVVITLANRTFMKDQPKANWRVAGFGVAKQYEGFNALAGVKEELDSIVRNSEDKKDKVGIMPGIIKMNDSFDEGALQMALLNHYQVLHIATHFKFVPGNDADSFLLLGNGKKLRLTDINGYHFAGIELLNLSACDTAMGDLGDGSEIEGFGMRAQHQGAKAVLATLWKVTDGSTSLLMQEFYKRRAMRTAKREITSKAEALRQAQLAYLRGDVDAIVRTYGKTSTAKNANKENTKAPFAHPYYWAPFILIGNAK